MALTTTIGGASSDSYATTAYAVTYFASIGRATDWAVITSAGLEEGLLRRAMIEIEAANYIGSRANNDAGSGIYQALEFPRKGTFYLGAIAATDGTIWTDLRGRRFTDDEIPEPIKQAQCEQALAMGNHGQWHDSRYKSQTVAVGDTSIDVVVGKELGLCLAAKRLLAPFLASRESAVIRN